MKKSVIILVMSLSLTACGGYRSYQREQDEKDAESKGKQTLLEAESSKRALIEEAKAKNQAAVLEAETKKILAKSEAEAEIERAKGVAESNKIIGQSLTGNEAYLRYLWIIGLQDEKGERIYIPTEAGLPILEARK